MNLRHFLHKAPAIFLNGRPVEIAEAFTESDQFLVAQRLVAKEQDRIVEPRLPDARECGIIQIFQIDPSHFGTEARASGDNLPRILAAQELELRFRTPMHRLIHLFYRP
jgi:hypothetical protein